MKLCYLLFAATSALASLCHSETEFGAITYSGTRDSTTKLCNVFLMAQAKTTKYDTDPFLVQVKLEEIPQLQYILICQYKEKGIKNIGFEMKDGSQRYALDVGCPDWIHYNTPDRQKHDYDMKTIKILTHERTDGIMIEDFSGTRFYNGYTPVDPNYIEVDMTDRIIIGFEVRVLDGFINAIKMRTIEKVSQRNLAAHLLLSGISDNNEEAELYNAYDSVLKEMNDKWGFHGHTLFSPTYFDNYARLARLGKQVVPDSLAKLAHELYGDKDSKKKLAVILHHLSNGNSTWMKNQMTEFDIAISKGELKILLEESK